MDKSPLNHHFPMVFPWFFMIYLRINDYNPHFFSARKPPLSRLGAHAEGLGRAGDLPSRWAENHGETTAKTMTFCWVKGDKHGG
jgi:hypothetical protein